MNYNHLYYFFITAKSGSVSRASERLMLAASTVSAQIRELESQLGHKLFERTGRGIRLTENGRIAYGYAEEIFELGAELELTMKTLDEQRVERLRIGVSDALPKLVLPELLDQAYSLEDPFRLTCRGDKTSQLALDLNAREVDLVICDTPLSAAGPTPLKNNRLGNSPMYWYAREDYAQIMSNAFPQSIHEAPLLLPTSPSPMRLLLDQWLDQQDIAPRIAGEFDDAELMFVFGASGRGVFAAPVLIESRLTEQYRVQRIGLIEGVVETYYGVTLDRGQSSEAIPLIMQSAREALSATETH